MVCGKGLGASVLDLSIGKESFFSSTTFGGFICVALFFRTFGSLFKFIMADLVVAFGLGVFAASTPLARHLAWSALPILGAVSVLARSSCKRVAKTIVATTTSLEPSTPAVLPKIKRPAVPSPVHETIANVSKNQTANVSNFAENVSTIESPSVVFEQVKSNLNLPSTGLTQVVLKETLESNDIFEDTS